MRESASAPNGLINLVHYDDAASAVLAAFEAAEDLRQEVFLVSDGAPLRLKEICPYWKFTPKPDGILPQKVYSQKSYPKIICPMNFQEFYPN